MISKEIFEIPIYRCKREKHYAQCQEDLNKLNEKAGEALSTETTQILRDLCYSPWEYNEVIGWLKFYPHGFDLVAEEWYDIRKRKYKDQKRKYVLNKPSAIKVGVNRQDTSEQILSNIYKELKDYQKNHHNRYVDISKLENIGKFINWRALMDNEFSNNGESIEEIPPVD